MNRFFETLGILTTFVIVGFLLIVGSRSCSAFLAGLGTQRIEIEVVLVTPQSQTTPTTIITTPEATASPPHRGECPQTGHSYIRFPESPNPAYWIDLVDRKTFGPLESSWPGVLPEIETYLEENLTNGVSFQVCGGKVAIDVDDSADYSVDGRSWTQVATFGNLVTLPYQEGLLRVVNSKGADSSWSIGFRQQ